MTNEKDALFRAVIPFMIWDNSIPYAENEMPPIGRWGTCFFIQNNDDFYAVTARHCLASADPRHIFLALPNQKMREIPIKEIIFSNYNDGIKTDTDVVLIKLAILDALIEKAKPQTQKLAQDILSTPYMKRKIRLIKRKKNQKAITQLTNSSFYKNMRKNQEKDLADIIEHVYTDDLKICVLKLRNNHDMQKDDSCVSLGIPNSDFNIDYVQNTIHSLILGADCKFVGFDQTRQDYVFECDNVAKLNGMSGGPILFKNTVIAMQHSVNIKENKIYGTTLTINFINDASQH